MVSKLVALMIIVSGLVFAQRSDTVYLTLATDSSSTVIANVTQNIGQSSHLLVINQKNSPGHTCANDLFTTGGLQYSFDQVTWVNFGSPGFSGTNSSSSASYVGLGAYPFVRANINFDTVLCLASVYYVGTIQTQTVYATGVTPPLSAVVDTNTGSAFFGKFNSYPVFTGGIGSRGVIQPNIICDGTALGTITSGNTISLTDIGTPVFNTNFAIYVCSIQATTAGTGTLRLIVGYKGTNNCQGGLLGNLTPAFNVISSAPLTMGSSNGFIAKTSGGTLPSPSQPQICGVATGADMQVMISYMLINNGIF